MAENSKIEWCDHTVNFWWGCTLALLSDGKLSEECRNCYALLLSKLFSRGKATWGQSGKRWIRHEAARRELYKIDKRANERGVHERVFINSMSDTFEDRDDLNEARGFLWDACKFVTNLDILLLTKRPENVLRMVPPAWLKDWPTHVWIGTTTGTQQAADERIPHLLSIPARVRFLSVEPMLGPVDIEEHLDDQIDGGYVLGSSPIHWVICGGESGPGARPMHPDWSRSMRDQCAAAGVPFFWKQWGDWREPLPGEEYDTSKGRAGSPPAFIVAPDGSVHCYHNDRTEGGAVMLRVGKKAAGRLLDGVEHDEFPTPAA
ncbi:phage Gp37/Gp68 family protein [Geminisphaera colitermitum]|uniref:phage Gp37/Gp68 family protein n=1 Tax=Geminisphaera colitermitum TaxID=1148786 RepID=UPI000158C711|nr:phage Gp37/Gp68 family protein [Geminisphaera colitermitum]